VDTTLKVETKLNPSYVGYRNDILRLVPNGVKKVLDVGCSTGTLGGQIIQKNGAEVIGIELDVQMAEIARKRLDNVIVANIEEFDFLNNLGSADFDCIIFADILEHLKDPWSVLKKSTQILLPEGIVISSIPNIRHYTTIMNLLFRGSWPYVERGIHDRTHLRFFTLRSIFEMFAVAGLEIVKVRRNYRIIERPHRMNKLTRFIAIPPLKNFLAYQYLVLAQHFIEKR
jgi:2-polyprenyl-3-methyl-5-hydroxy-6-metoxy-1,4-benzoquinol methylase